MAEDEEPIRFGNEAKLRKQMRKRRWTEREIREALASPGIPARGKHHAAMRHVHPRTGKSLLIDAETGEIFHLGQKGYDYGAII